MSKKSKFDKDNPLDRAMDKIGCFKTRKFTIANTEQFMAMAVDAEENERNRSVYVRKLSKGIDPDGTHICAFRMLHGDYEYRTAWLVKIKDRIQPAILWLDIDHFVFSKNTTELEKEEVELEDIKGVEEVDLSQLGILAAIGGL